MKKIAMLFGFPLILGACDSKPQAEILFSACCEAQEKYGVMKLSVWDDKMVLNVKGEEVLLKDENIDQVPSNVYPLSLTGVIPSSKEEVLIHVDYDAKEGYLADISFSINNHGYEGVVYTPVRLKGYRVPDAIEQCISDIDSLTRQYNKDVFIYRDVVKWESRGMQKLNEQSYYSKVSVDIKIPTDDAIAISENWNPKNFKGYTLFNDETPVDEHEKDACDVLARLKTYIAKKGYDKPVDVYLDEIGCDNPTKVIELGANRLLGYNTYEYFVLNICENGNHYMTNANGPWMYDRLDVRSSWLPVREEMRDGKTVYSAFEAGGSASFTIVYNHDSDEYGFLGQDGKYTVLEKLNNFQKHNLCSYLIYNRVRVNSQIEVKFGNGNNERFVPLTQEQALLISENWDYKNMKLYHTGEFPHEKDACDVYNRLSEFIRTAE